MNLRQISSSLVTRLAIAGVLLVVSGTAVRYVFLSKFLREDLTQVVSRQQVALAENIAREIDYKIVERRQLLERLAARLPLDYLGKPDRLRDWLGERHELQPLFSTGLIVADPDGTLLVDYPPMPGRVGRSVAGNPDFHEARGGRSVIGRPMLGAVSNLALLPMGVPVKDGSGKVRAVLIGNTALSAPGFLDHLREGLIGETGGFLLISPRDKIFVAASDPAMVLRPTPPPGVNALHDRAMEGFRGSGVTVNAKGVEEISAMVSVPSTGWFVVARLPTAEALVTVQRAKEYTIRNGVLGVAFILTVVVAIIYWMLLPLHRAAAEAERMTSGETPLAPLPVVHDDEVGMLTAAFNGLLVKLVGSQAELERMAHHDPLTGLPNRTLLADRMRRELARARRKNNRVALLYMDLDGFKSINDTLGHDAGDEVLREVAGRLLGVVREADTLARVGGDEFVLLVGDLDDTAEERTCVLAEKCIAAVVRPLHIRGAEYTLGVSVGIASCGGACDTDRLLGEADQAMYAAKQQGGSRYVLAPHCDDPAPQYARTTTPLTERTRTS